MKDKAALQTLENRITTELLWHLNEGADQIFFSALVEDADDETTIEDLLWSVEHLRKKKRTA
jgi:hypothetical protein